MSDRTIGRVAEAVGVGVETIRFNERRELIDQPPRPVGGGYRVYPDETVRRVQFIRRAQELGFSLREIAELLSLRADHDADASDMRRRATANFKMWTGRSSGSSVSAKDWRRCSTVVREKGRCSAVPSSTPWNTMKG